MAGVYPVMEKMPVNQTSAWHAESMVLDEGPGQIVRWFNPTAPSGVGLHEHLRGLVGVVRSVQSEIWRHCGQQARFALASPIVSSIIETLQVSLTTQLVYKPLDLPRVGQLSGMPIFSTHETDVPPYLIGRGEMHFFFAPHYQWKGVQEIPIYDQRPMEYDPDGPMPVLRMIRREAVCDRPARAVGVIKLRGYAEPWLKRLARMSE